MLKTGSTVMGLSASVFFHVNDSILKIFSQAVFMKSTCQALQPIGFWGTWEILGGDGGVGLFTKF